VVVRVCLVRVLRLMRTDCAELVNSITNLIFIFLSVKGMRNCLKEGHDLIFFISFMGLFVVGVGSFLFHSTLWCEFLYIAPYMRFI
jgi:hypothetical protein